MMLQVQKCQRYILKPFFVLQREADFLILISKPIKNIRLCRRLCENLHLPVFYHQILLFFKISILVLASKSCESPVIVVSFPFQIH